MSIPSALVRSVGEWAGQNRLWFLPTQPAFESATTATAHLEAGGNFLSMRYDWSHEGTPQQGFLLIGEDASTNRCDVAWVDSFHNGQRLMPCSGPVSSDGVLRATGSYPAPTGPDWHWRIELSSPEPDRLLMRMYNIKPDATEALAVEASYSRRR